mmetsp:Transcript_128441/g.287164  ORF Transcript_128441/g.287164 Transcript_128441/m.287164 type:complete len:495 (+) Transcript_128441:61-1545(+)
MSKYGKLSRTEGHSQWFLQRTLQEHDRSMDHPWMQMIYRQSFGIRQYAAWLARNHAVFKAFEEYVEVEALRCVHEAALLRTKALEGDLLQLLGANWQEEAAEMAQDSPSTQRYLASLVGDAAKGWWCLLAHHFLQYNAVLSGGAYLGEMVSQKLCVPHGAPGVQFYAFAGVEKGKGPARVQKYIRAFDGIQLSEEERDDMLEAMKRIYADTEAMMQEVYDIQPATGVSYASAKAEGAEAAAPAPLPPEELLELTLAQLRGYVGEDLGRILLSLAGELLDVTTGREMYGPGGSYSMLAGRDVTRCLATMSLEPSELDDLAWQPRSPDDENALAQWREKLKAKYPVAGRLKPEEDVEGAGEGLRRRAAAPAAAAPAAESAPKAVVAAGDVQKCPISGKEGAGCPMSKMMGIGGGGGSAAAGKAPAEKAAAAPGSFMAGKSLIASVEKSSASQESFLFRLCPLHWDDNTIKMIILIAAASWVSGVFVGWKLHKELMS